MWQNDHDQTEVRSRHFPSGTEKDQSTLHSGQLVSGTKFEPGISDYETNESTARSPATFGTIYYKVLLVLAMKFLADKADKWHVPPAVIKYETASPCFFMCVFQISFIKTAVVPVTLYRWKGASLTINLPENLLTAALANFIRYNCREY